MGSLRSRAIHLAHTNPELRTHLLPMLTRTSARSLRVLTREEIAGLGAAVINKALDRLEKESSEINDELIAAGFGHMGLQQISRLDHPVAQKYNQNYAQLSMLRDEIDRRYGPGAPSRLPRGFGPIKAI